MKVTIKFDTNLNDPITVLKILHYQSERDSDLQAFLEEMLGGSAAIWGIKGEAYVFDPPLDDIA